MKKVAIFPQDGKKEGLKGYLSHHGMKYRQTRILHFICSPHNKALEEDIVLKMALV